MGKKLTQEEFIEKAILVHGNRYNYDLVKYKLNNIKIKIICKNHGIFEQIPNSHLNGKGCPDCGMDQIIEKLKLTTKEFIKKAKKVHNNFYDYSLVDYQGIKIKVKIICPEHGEFEQVSGTHLQGKGCSSCTRNKKLTTKEFIEKAILVHGNKYDYSLVDYKGRKTKIKIICPEHGEFEQDPNNHLSNHGCTLCAGNKKLTTKEFIKKSNIIHKNKYDYSLVNYENSNTKIKIICPEHGEFKQTPTAHLRNQGCPKCGIKKVTDQRKSNTNEFIKKSQKIHGNKYDYSLVDYKNDNTKIKIICKNCNKIFTQKPNKHLQKHGCTLCAKSGFNPNKPAILYYIKLKNNLGNLYKIGITNRTIQERYYQKDQKLFQDYKIIHFKNGQEAFDYEQKTLNDYYKYKYKGPDILTSGNTEIFTKDVLHKF